MRSILHIPAAIAAFVSPFPPNANSCRAGERSPDSIAIVEQRLEGHDEAVTSLSFSATSSFLASSDANGRIIVWKLGAPSVQCQLIDTFKKNHGGLSLSFDPKSGHLHAFREGIVEELGLPENGQMQNGQSQFSPDATRAMRTEIPWECKAIAFSRDGNLSAHGFSSHWEQGTYSIDRGTNEPPDPPVLMIKLRDEDLLVDEFLLKLDQQNSIQRLAFHPSGKYLAIGGGTFDDGYVVLAEFDRKKLVRRAGPVHCTGPVRSMSYSPDGSLLAIGTNETHDGKHSAQVIILNGSSLERVTEFDAGNPRVGSLAFSPKAKELFIAGYEPNIRVYSTDKWQLLTSLRGHKGRVWDIKISPDGERLASAGDDKSVFLWKLTKPAPDLLANYAPVENEIPQDWTKTRIYAAVALVLASALAIWRKQLLSLFGAPKSSGDRS